MSATDELRRLLDEREVEWRVGDYPTTCTVWESDGIVWHGLWRDGCIELIAWQVTPEQAVAATLGAGTCKDVGRYAFVCSVCGWASDEPHHVLGGFWPNYCPNCGRRVVE